MGSALLLPLAGGFCLLQIIVMWLAVQGVGIADAGWSAMLSRIQQTGMVGHPNIPSARPLVASIFRSEVCMAAMNKSYEASGRSERIQLVEIPRSVLVRVPDTVNNAIDSIGLLGMGYKPAETQTTTFAWQSTGGYTRNDVCGRLEWEESSASEAGNARHINLRSVYHAHGRYVRDVIIPEMRSAAQAIVAGQKPEVIPIADLAYRYENELRDLSRQAVASIDNSPRDKVHLLR